MRTLALKGGLLNNNMVNNAPPNFEVSGPLDIRTCVFNRSNLNRLNNERRYESFLQSNLTAKSRFLVFSHTLQVLTYLSPAAKLALLPLEHVPPFQTDAVDPPLLVLGRDDNDVPHLAIRLPLGYNPTGWLSTLPREPGTPKFLHLRSASRTLDHDHAAMSAHARALFEFHTRHAFCGTCGAATLPEQGGTRRRCERNIHSIEPPVTGSNNNNNDPSSQNNSINNNLSLTSNSTPTITGCTGMWFPRTDPVVIMLVVDHSGERVLLGRQKRFAGGLFSCLAGFMEHGEGVDDAVRREVLEESGVNVGRVRFFGSQAWPFPYSLMLGCIAEANQQHIKVDEHELEDAQWFSREDVKAMVDRAQDVARGGQGSGFIVPPPTSIAGQMLTAYAAGDAITSFSTDRPTYDQQPKPKHNY